MSIVWEHFLRSFIFGQNTQGMRGSEACAKLFSTFKGFLSRLLPLKELCQSLRSWLETNISPNNISFQPHSSIHFKCSSISTIFLQNSYVITFDISGSNIDRRGRKSLLADNSGKNVVRLKTSPIFKTTFPCYFYTSIIKPKLNLDNFFIVLFYYTFSFLVMTFKSRADQSFFWRNTWDTWDCKNFFLTNPFDVCGFTNIPS